MASSSTIATFPIEDKRPSPAKSFAKVLTVDIGGSSVKVMASGQTEPRKRRSGKKLTPAKMVEIVQELAERRAVVDSETSISLPSLRRRAVS
jgi:polyphosphate glucokinase